MAGNLVMHEKGWLGHKQMVLHSGEGPIWQVRWRDRLIAWANDLVRSKDPCAEDNRYHYPSGKRDELIIFFRVSKFMILSPKLASPSSTDP
jgi:hypothetical protein